jgi:hypothetical protein
MNKETETAVEAAIYSAARALVEHSKQPKPNQQDIEQYMKIIGMLTPILFESKKINAEIEALAKKTEAEIKVLQDPMNISLMNLQEIRKQLVYVDRSTPQPR